ncbi:MAG: inositol monophosphatase family protein [Alphaproteobacteria bacterium]
MRTPVINVMTKAVMRAARGLARDFGELEQLQVSRKGPGDFVTAADIRSEEILRNDLERAHPTYGFLMEEGGAQGAADAEYQWIIDPLDGTTNFMNGIPFFCISLALHRKEHGVIAGMIYDPIKDELFWAEKGNGAFASQHRRDRRLRVSGKEKLEDALLAMGFHQTDENQGLDYIQISEALRTSSAGMRRMGSNALDLAYVAAGRFDGVWLEGAKPWDVAAGKLIIREAGGKATTCRGETDILESGSVVAGNGMLHRRLMKLIK